jgi:SAM-dependent methyltransferase
MPASRDARRRSFDSVAELYATARPGYPAAVFDEVERQAPPPARVLEIGPGPGQATRVLAARGYAVVGIELGEAMARVARERLATFPAIEIVRADFHEWEPEPASFNVVFAASAFQWVDPAVSYPKARRALRSGGLLALVWSHPVRGRHAVARFWDANEEVYRRAAPSIAEPRGAPRRTSFDPRPGARASRLFGPMTRRSWRWRQPFTTDAQLALMATYSNHITLDPTERSALEQGMRELIDGEFGGQIVREFLTTLYTARAR